MNELKKLSQEEKEMLFKAPAYVSLLATNTSQMDEQEKNAAFNLSHIKTFSSIPLLRQFYTEAEKEFNVNIDLLNASLPKDKHQREDIIKSELAKLEPIFAKLESDYSASLIQSFTLYANYVSRAHDNILESFVIPFYIKGLTS